MVVPFSGVRWVLHSYIISFLKGLTSARAVQSAISASLENCASNCVYLMESQKILRWQSEETILRGMLSAEVALDPPSMSAEPRPRTRPFPMTVIVLKAENIVEELGEMVRNLSFERLFHRVDGVKLTCHDDTYWLCIDALKAVLRTEGITCLMFFEQSSSA